MLITDYTSYNEVRSACGQSTDNLPDSKLSEELYANSLELTLDDVSLPDEEPGPGPLKTRYLTIKAIDESSRTTLQQKLYNLTRLYSTYAVALEACIALSMSAPKTISDSKVTLTRFSPESVYRDVIERLTEKLKEIKDKIENINEDTITSLPYLTVINSSFDPVTNE